MDAERWDQRYREGGGGTGPARVLEENPHLLPLRGRALDLACGPGANSLFLASRGLDVHAWDFSPVAIERLRAAALDRGLSVTTEVRDVLSRPPEPQSFDVIVVSRFLERSLVSSLTEALRPGGVIFYQTFLLEAIDKTVGPKNRCFRLGKNELLGLFSSLYLLYYREEGRVGDVSQGFRNEAMLVAEKASV